MQKKAISWLLMILMMFILFVLGSCDEAQSPTEPDFTSENWMDGYPIILLLDDLGDESGTWLITESYPGEVAVVFNEVNATVGSPEFRTEEDRWYTRIYGSGLTEGATIPYKITINGNELTGSARIPARPIGVFPFYTSGDYSYEWTTTQAPDLYLSRFEYTYQSYFDEVYETLPGSSLNHTILSSLWGGSVIYPLNLRLTALNYQENSGGILVVSPVSISHDFGTSRRK